MNKITWHNEKRTLGQLIPYEHNPRQLTKKQYEDLRNSLSNFDLAEIPAINTDNKIVAGHQRTKILKELKGGDYEIDVRVPNRALTEAEFKEYLIRSNANTGEWDMDILANDFELPDLQEWGVDGLDFGVDDIGAEGLTDEDSVPEIPQEPKTKLGDIYKLGEHRLMCGDSTSVDAVEKLMDGEKADMIFTDPMYDMDPKELVQIFHSIEVNDFFVMATFSQCAVLATAFLFKFDIVLNQKVPSSMMNKKVPYYLHKNVIYFQKEKKDSIFHCDNAKGTFSENGYYPSVIESPKNSKDSHGLSKNVDGIVKLLSGFSYNHLLDLFAGGGSTLIACEQKRKKCSLMELSPSYCDVIVKRWEDYTGEKSELL